MCAVSEGNHTGSLNYAQTAESIEFTVEFLLKLIILYHLLEIKLKKKCRNTQNTPQTSNKCCQNWVDLRAQP